MKQLVAFFTLWLSVVCFAGVSDSARLVYGEYGKVASYNPYQVDESAAYRLSSLLYEQLIDVSIGGEYVGRLAKDWSISKDGASVDFTLKKSIYWHAANSIKRGAELTSKDVVSTVEMIKRQGHGLANFSRYSSIKSAEATGKYSVRLMFNRSLTDPLKNCMFTVLPWSQASSRSVFARGNEDFVPVGTGPYRFVKSNSQGEILLKSTDYYHGKKPNIKTILMQSFLDKNVMSQSLMYRSLDLITEVSPRDLPELKGDNKITVVPYESLSYSFIGMNTSNGILRDKRVRQAIVHAVDRQAMLDSFFSGEGRVISGPFSPTSWAYNIDVRPASYDPVRARELLKSVGLKDKNADGYYEDRNGKNIELTFLVPMSGRGETIKRIVLGFQNYMADVGIKVDLKFSDWLVWKTKVLKEKDFDLTIANWSFDEASNITSLFHSGEIKPWGYNFVGFSDPMVDSLLVEAELTNSSDKRRLIYHKLHAILNDKSPYLFLWSLKNHSGMQNNVSGVRVEPFDYFRHIAQWRKGGGYVK